MNKIDPTGEFAESLFDVGFIVADIIDIASNGLNAANGASLAGNIVGLALPGATGVGLATRGAVEGAQAASKGIAKNAADGAAREAKVSAALKAENPGAKVQNQQSLRTADGKIAKDPKTGEGRRVDHAVIKDGKAQTYETTSMTADKTGQLAKEQRIIDSGGSYVRDRDTKQLVPVCGVSDVKRC